eukprot:CAMPEP_0194282326 /NCGR_PEP_ID=MMETSP0169-20130528/22914_1 /TAXON_ID=218684 /ORGANISM="Corethron pennatum, Strain L29A3" /LENGTH=189 /DNA_ID=CAMNT_0039027605 /DNA_START=119 /DNA_END=688 /DNA_ORIENTATION=+
MKRPILDRIASSLYDLEMNRVNSSSIADDQGRTGEPMEWSEPDSLANKFSEFMAGGIGYQFKQTIADIVAGQYDREITSATIRRFVDENPVAVVTFSTCPFCRRATDYLDSRSIPHVVLELDSLEGNTGNEIRAELGRFVKRTSVPCVFIGGECIGGCNDGTPGLFPLVENGNLDGMLDDVFGYGWGEN